AFAIGVLRGGRGGIPRGAGGSLAGSAAAWGETVDAAAGCGVEAAGIGAHLLEREARGLEAAALDPGAEPRRFDSIGLGEGEPLRHAAGAVPFAGPHRRRRDPGTDLALEPGDVRRLSDRRRRLAKERLGVLGVPGVA